MKATVKYLNNVQDIIPNLKKEYDIYVSNSGYPVIEVLDSEIPVFDMKNQKFEIAYKIPKELQNTLTSDDGRYYTFWITIILNDEALEYVSKVFNKKRKEIAKKQEEEKLEKKKKIAETLAAGKAKKKSEIEEEINEEL